MSEQRQPRRGRGDRLHRERRRLGLTQAEMASLGGVSKPTQLAYETGQTSPHADYLAGVAAGGVDVLWVVTGNRDLAAIDLDLLMELVALIEEWAAERSGATSLSVKKDLLRTLYSQFADSGSIDLGQLETVFRLVG